MSRHFLVVGAQRCGTTYLHDLLAGTYVAHPTPDVSLAGGRDGRRFRRSGGERRKLPV